MSDFDTIRYEVNDGVAAITLARPEKRNALSLDMFRELGNAAEAAGGDPAVRAVLVAGEGPSFCAGIDLGLLAKLAPLVAETRQDPDGFRSFVRMAQRPFLALATMPKPTLAAVHGHALGAGFQLALACDLRVATTDVRFGMLEARYGLIPDLGGMYHLARLVGPARTKELVWTTRTVEAEEGPTAGSGQWDRPAGRSHPRGRGPPPVVHRPPWSGRLAGEAADRRHFRPVSRGRDGARGRSPGHGPRPSGGGSAPGRHSVTCWHRKTQETIQAL